jgi:RNA polymerase sigma-70 factor (ECF subfamily)
MTPKPTIDEIAIVARIAQQDQTAIAELYDRYARILYAVAFKILGIQEETEEVVLDVFQQVWRAAARYNPQKARVDTWLFMQIRSRALDKLRSRQRVSRIQEVSLDAVDIEVQAATSNPVEDVVILERRTMVVAAIKQLPPEQQQVIELVYFQGLTHGEIAAATGVALGTIKTRIRLALSKLRAALASLDDSELA